MSFPQKHTVSVTTASDGSVTGTTTAPGGVRGRISECIYTKVDFADGVDFAITTEDTGQNIWTQANVNGAVTIAPRQATHTAAGVAATYNGTAPVLDHIYCAGEQIQVAIVQGGDTKTGTFEFIVV